MLVTRSGPLQLPLVDWGVCADAAAQAWMQNPACRAKVQYHVRQLGANPEWHLESLSQLSPEGYGQAVMRPDHTSSLVCPQALYHRLQIQAC